MTLTDWKDLPSKMSSLRFRLSNFFLPTFRKLIIFTIRSNLYRAYSWTPAARFKDHYFQMSHFKIIISEPKHCHLPKTSNRTAFERFFQPNYNEGGNYWARKSHLSDYWHFGQTVKIRATEMKSFSINIFQLLWFGLSTPHLQKSLVWMNKSLYFIKMK